MKSVGERLGKAIKKYGPRSRGRPGAEGSVRGFQKKIEKEMNKKGLTGYGTSRQMIYRYLKPDGPKPPEEFLRAAAEILDPVRYEWLATGEGEMEKAREKAREVTATLTRVASALATSSATIRIPADSEFQLSGGPSKVLADVMKPVFDALAVPDDTSPTWVGGLIALWRELTESGLEGMGDEYKMIADALRAPIDAFDVNLDEMPTEVLDAYVFGMVPGLLALAREARDQRAEGQ